MEKTNVSARIKWTFDPHHSEIGFKVKHLMLTNVRGVFSEYNGTVQTDEDDFTKADIELTINTASVSTNNEGRDGHLKSPDFFDAEKFKEIKFKSSSLINLSGNEYALQGDLTIKDVTKAVKLDVEFNGIVKDPYGNRKAGFEITGKISRKEFGLTWNAALETGGVVVGDDVTIKCDIQLIQQP